MKTKKVTTKLTLHKSTIAILGQEQQLALKGGYNNTRINTSCPSWHPICNTRPRTVCLPLETVIMYTCDVC
jgi:hypothetical protein